MWSPSVSQSAVYHQQPGSSASSHQTPPRRKQKQHGHNNKHANQQQNQNQNNAADILHRLLVSPTMPKQQQHIYSSPPVNVKHVASYPSGLRNQGNKANHKTGGNGQEYAQGLQFVNQQHHPQQQSHRRRAMSAAEMSPQHQQQHHQSSAPHNQSPVARLSPISRTCYAGPKFSESPSAKDLPPPPIRWVLDSMLTAQLPQAKVPMLAMVK
jgi:hypothetical protein